MRPRAPWPPPLPPPAPRGTLVKCQNGQRGRRAPRLEGCRPLRPGSCRCFRRRGGGGVRMRGSRRASTSTCRSSRTCRCAVFVHLTIFFLSFHPSVYLSFFLCIHLSIYPYIYPCIYLSIYLSIHSSNNLSINLSICVDIYVCMIKSHKTVKAQIWP